MYFKYEFNACKVEWPLSAPKECSMYLRIAFNFVVLLQ